MKKTFRKLISVVLVVLMVFSLGTPAFAAGTGSVDIRPTITLDKKSYQENEQIKITVKTENQGNAEAPVTLEFKTTTFISMETKSDDIGVVKANDKVTTTYSAVAGASGIAELGGIFKAVRIVFGYIVPAIYNFLTLLMTDSDSQMVTIGDIAAVVVVKAVPQYDETEEPETPDETEVYNVSFNLNYEGAETINPIKVKSGEIIATPVPEVRDNFQFIGWYFNDSIFDFSGGVTQDMELTARWYDETDTTDSDNDGISDSVEAQFGTDPASNDTDNDGVSDYNELNWLNSDAKDEFNGEDDFDNDKLSNAEEDKLGTNPAYSDSDYDNLSDFDEVFVYNTNPLNNDTDNDGVNDGTEIQNGSDPLTIENEFITENKTGEISENSPVVASASVVTDNTGAGSLTITEVTHSDNIFITEQIPGYLGSAYDFSVDGTFISATITFEYDTSLGTIGDNFEPRIYYVNENGEFEELPNQTVENGKVSATVEHFSTYILLNKKSFDLVWDKEIKPVDYKGDGKTGIDIVFVVDSSGSMDWNDSNNIRHQAVKNFIVKLTEYDRAAVVDFDDSARVYQTFTNDHTSLNNAVNRIDSSGGTSLSAGMRSAINLFTQSSYTRTDAYKYIVFLTDGDGSYSSSYTTTAKNNDIVVYTIGLGSGVKENVLKQIAQGTNGKYYFASSASNLPDIYEDVSFETVDYITDSNSDGISDYYTELIDDGKLLLSNGMYDLVNVIDQYGADCADWDNDGLLNGEEITVKTSGSSTYIVMKSHPLIADSDGDSLPDAAEVNDLNTDPLKITKGGASSIENLIDGSMYVYVEQVNDKSIGNAIAGFFDWQKTDESKETFINYFYDYASNSSINKNAEEIKKLATREAAWQRVETIVNIAGLGKSLLDLGTDLNSYDASVKAQITKYNKKHTEIVRLFNNKKYDEIIDEYSDVKEYEKIFDIFDGLYDTITKDNGIEKSAAVIGLIASGKKLISGLKTFKFDLGKKINSFSNKYQTFLGKAPTGDITYGTVIGVGFDVASIVTDVAKVNNLYGKLQANSEAFNEYIELIEYISNNGNGKDYIKVAAGDIIKIILDKTNTEYYKQLNKAIASETAEEFIDIAISIVGDFNPYVKVAEMVIGIVKVSISLTGMTEYAKSLVKSQCIDAISDGCIYYLNGLIDYEGIWFSYSSEDEERVYHYLTQLAQSRIVGEDSICSFLKKWSLATWISKIISNTSNEDLDNIFNTLTRATYNRSKNLDLILSDKLPRRPHGGGGSL